MNEFIEIHATHPQQRLIRKTVEVLHRGGIIVYPTDSGYALGCHIGDKLALDRIRRIREVGPAHNFTLICRDLSEIGTFAKITNSDYRILKAHTPGPYTFILKATREVPRRLQHSKRKTIGIRVPDNAIVWAILEVLGQPLMSSSLILPGEDMPLAEPEIISDLLKHQVDMVIDGGIGLRVPTTVVDLVEEYPALIREGGGDISWINP